MEKTNEKLTRFSLPAFKGQAVQDRAEVYLALKRALENDGFIQVSDLDLPIGLLALAFKQMRAFFSLPQEQKDRVRFDGKPPTHGYIHYGHESLDVTSSTFDRKELYNIIRSSPIVTPNPTFDWRNRWPTEPPAFEVVMKQVLLACHDITTQLIGAVEEALGWPTGHLGEKHAAREGMLRLLHYPPSDGDPDEGLGAGEHTDHATLTLLLQDGASGLERKTTEGDWLPVTSKLGEAVCNPGDMLQHWSRNKVLSPTHRVQPMKGNTHRYVIAYFSLPPPTTKLTPPGVQPLPPFTAGDFMLARARQRQASFEQSCNNDH